MATLKIKSADQCKWDGVALGEVMLRFDPGDVPFERARTCRIWHGGGETNVAEGMAYCFRLRSTVLTAMVDDGFGRNIECQFREAGVDTSHVIWFKAGGKEGKYVTDKKGGLMNGINATFLPGHFKVYTVKLNPLDGVYYCDIRPNMTTDPLLRQHIRTIDHFFATDLWRFVNAPGGDDRATISEQREPDE